MIVEDPDVTIDARGLKCPLPLVHAKQSLSQLEPGALLKVKTTDPEAPFDLAAWCDDEGHDLTVEVVYNGHDFLIRKSAV